jgi:hypothetical protein
MGDAAAVAIAVFAVWGARPDPLPRLLALVVDRRTWRVQAFDA